MILILLRKLIKNIFVKSGKLGISPVTSQYVKTMSTMEINFHNSMPPDLRHQRWSCKCHVTPRNVCDRTLFPRRSDTIRSSPASLGEYCFIYVQILRDFEVKKDIFGVDEANTVPII